MNVWLNTRKIIVVLLILGIFLSLLTSLTRNAQAEDGLYFVYIEYTRNSEFKSSSGEYPTSMSANDALNDLISRSGIGISQVTYGRVDLQYGAHLGQSKTIIEFGRQR
mgnify:CR=1 FL=1